MKRNEFLTALTGGIALTFGLKKAACGGLPPVGRSELAKTSLSVDATTALKDPLPIECLEFVGPLSPNTKPQGTGLKKGQFFYVTEETEFPSGHSLKPGGVVIALTSNPSLEDARDWHIFTGLLTDA